MKTSIKFFIPMLSLFLFSCGQSSENSKSGDDGKDSINVQLTPAGGWTMTVGGITVSEKTESSAYPEAELSMSSPAGNLASGSPAHFEFGINNYDLQTQSPDADFQMCANSGKGQHIHLILNNAPYLARYETSFDEHLEDGNYVCLAFLSRSYHESIKNGKAYVLNTFSVGDVESTDVDLSAAHLFYSRPKGTYTGDDTHKVLLDFFLTNCDLSEDGYHVKVSIDGNDFNLTKWVPYWIEGMPMGENTIRLELLDASGNKVDSPFNPVERTIILEDTPIAS